MDSYPQPERSPLPLQPEPLRLSLPHYSAYVSYAIFGLNIAVFLLDLLLNQMLTAYGLRINGALTAGEYWRLFTPIFLHGGLLHIAFNSYFLFIVGPQVERAFGQLRFLLLYMLAGLGGVLFGYFFSRYNSLGASGALFGLMGGLAAFVFRNQEMLSDSKARLGSLARLIGINLLFGLTPGIDNWAHLGGLLIGAGLSYFIAPRYQLSIEAGAPPRVVDATDANIVWLVSGLFLAGLLLLFFVVRAFRL